MSKRLQEWAIEYWSDDSPSKCTYSFLTDEAFDMWEAVRVGIDHLKARRTLGFPKLGSVVSVHKLGKKEVLP
jgi:hypothetical protein